MTRYKLLEIIPTIPYPVKAGGTMALFSMLDQLRSYLDITIVFVTPNENDDKLTQLKELWPEVHMYAFTIRKSKNLFLQKIGQRLYSKGVLREKTIGDWVLPFMRYTPELIKYISDIIALEKPDLIQTEFYGNQDLVYALPDEIKKIYVQHEIRYVVNKLWLESHHLTDNSYAKSVFRLLKSEEIGTMNSYDAVLTLNDADNARIRNDGVYKPVYTSPVGVLPAVERNECKFSNKLIFIGAGGHPPNVEGVEWFVTNILPDIIKNIPDIEFHIIGMWSPSQKAKFEGKANIYFDGYVEDLGRALEGAITVVPILSGSGIRMKILDAVNHGSPFISTTIGALDMGFEDGRDCFIADKVELFKDKLLKLIQNEELRRRFYVNSFKVYKERYSIQELASRRMRIYDELMKN